MTATPPPATTCTARLPSGEVRHYIRDEAGVWRRAATGEPVPGATDMTISNLYNFRVAAGRVEVPIGLAREQSDLRWCLEWLDPAATVRAALRLAPHGAVEVADAQPDHHRDPDTGKAVICVPLSTWDAQARAVIGMWAPELA